MAAAMAPPVGEMQRRSPILMTTGRWSVVVFIVVRVPEVSRVAQDGHAAFNVGCVSVSASLRRRPPHPATPRRPPHRASPCRPPHRASLRRPPHRARPMMAHNDQVVEAEAVATTAR
jgi:hypothetical protein